MYDRSKKEITFPHLIPGNKLAGKTYTPNDINGGMTKPADLGIDVNSFYGGRVIMLGWNTQLGLYICPSWEDQRYALGFYVHDASKLTLAGREALIQRFPEDTVIFERELPSELTAEEKQRLLEAKQFYVDHGIAPSIVSTSTEEELINLLKVNAAGQAEKIRAVAEQVEPEAYAPDAVKVHDGSQLPDKVLANRVQAKTPPAAYRRK